MDTIQYDPTPLNVNRLLEKVKSSMSVQAVSKSILIENHVLLSHYVYADNNMIKTVLRNLVSNAIKFSKEGQKIIVSSVEKSNFIQIKIKDQGLGMSKSEQEELFDLHLNKSATGTSGESGTGLGLIICKEFVDLNKGQIELKSEKYKGTTVSVSLPKYVKDEKDAEDFHKNPEDAENPVLLESGNAEKQAINEPGQEILLIEDNENILNSLAEKLSEKYTVLTAIDGSSGLKIAFNALPDLIVSDIMLPKTNGTEICQQIKSNEKTSHIPVILITANESDKVRLEGLEKGADDYITKPFSTDNLVARIENLLKNRQRLKDKYLRHIKLMDENLNISDPDEDFIISIIQHIERNLSKPKYSAESLSKDMSVSYMQLYRKIERITNRSPVEFIQRIKVAKAAMILMQNQGSVSQTAFDCGFKDPSYFTKVFKTHFGKTPKQYYLEQV